MSHQKKGKLSQESATSNQFQEIQQIAPLKNKSQQVPPGATASKINKNFFQRTKTTIYMLLGFILVLSMGHFYVSLLILILTFGIFKQVSQIKRNVQKQNQIPMTPILTWYIYGLIVYFAIGKVILAKLPIQVLKNQVLKAILKYHNFVFFCLFVSAFLMFVLTLRNRYMKYQFKIFGWTLLASILIMFPGFGMLMNVHEGMCWFLIPTLLIICNDIFAYLVGYFFGKTPLIELSPKKTWQGYLGGAFFTIIFSLVLSHIVAQFPILACPQNNLNLVFFDYPICKNPILQSVKINLLLFDIYPTQLQLHVLILAVFASLIGPFGGFFASGLKRSIKIKDFANLIPGHGGITDRMDCQLLMGAFTYFYLHSIVLENVNNFSIFLNNFTILQQHELFNILKLSLQNKSI